MWSILELAVSNLISKEDVGILVERVNRTPLRTCTVPDVSRSPFRLNAWENCYLACPSRWHPSHLRKKEIEQQHLRSRYTAKRVVYKTEIPHGPGRFTNEKSIVTYGQTRRRGRVNKMTAMYYARQHIHTKYHTSHTLPRPAVSGFMDQHEPGTEVAPV